MLKRSILLVVLPVVGVAMLVGSIVLEGPPARAATPVYADPAGTCASMAPCFTTIQEAVNNAGPAPAMVNIFPGTYVEEVNLSDMGSALEGSPGDITLQAVSASGAPAVGTATISPVTGHAIYEDTFPFPGSVTINGINATSDSDTFDFWAAGNITLSGTTTNDSGSDGVDVASDSTVTITNSTANNNSNGGFDIRADGDITVTGSTANGNTDSEGFQLDADPGSVTITGSTANNNSSEGIQADAFEGDFAATDVTANGNGDDGIDAFGDNVTVTNVTANDNEDEGVQTAAAGNTLIDRVTAIGNLGDGVDPEGESIEGYVAGNVTVRDSNLQTNDSGIEMLETPTSLSGALLANSNVLCGNDTAGLTSLDDQSINAEGNWWGAATGPTHPSNATGTGDDVLDGANPGTLTAQGTVDFSPFISTSSGSGSAVVGQASTISFEFTGASGAVKLQEGPGDETGASPWSVTTSNGTATVGFLSSGKLDVTLTAATVGTANVTVTGPCGLSATLAVAVAAAQASPSPTQTPAQLPQTGAAPASSSSLPLAAMLAIGVIGLAAVIGGGIAARRVR